MGQEDVLEFLKQHKGKPYTVIELSKELGINKSGLYRMCGILSRVKFIKKVKDKRRFFKNNHNVTLNCYVYDELCDNQ